MSKNTAFIGVNRKCKGAKRQKSKEGAQGPLITYEIVAKSSRGQSRLSTAVTLSIPGDEEECPLTLELIKRSQLPILSDISFLEDRPNHSKLTLPCGHSFHAMSLIYSFCKNGMTCPCCRAGHQQRADPLCLPEHFRVKMADKVKQTLQEERADEETLVLYGLVVPYATLADEGCLRMVLNFFLLPGGAAAFSFSCLLRMNEARDGMCPNYDERTVSNTLRMGVNAMQILVQLTIRDVGTVNIDSSPVFTITPAMRVGENAINLPGAVGRVDQTGDIPVHLINNEGNTSFYIALSERERGVSLTRLQWRCPPNLELISPDQRVGGEGAVFGEANF